MNHRERDQKKKELQGSPPKLPSAIHYNRRTDKIHCVRNDQSKEPKTQLNTKKRAESHSDNYVGTIFLHNFMQFAQIQVKREKPESYS